MLQTVEIQTPLKSSNNQFVNGRHVLYEAFNLMVLPGSVKDYPRWRRDRNRRWVGGLTGEGNVASLSDIPLSVTLRESKGMVQLVVANRPVEELDGARRYKGTNDGWEFASSDPRILMDARQYKRGRQCKIIAVCRFPDTPITYTRDEPISSIDQPMNRLAHEVIFAELMCLLKEVEPKNYPAKEVLTSPSWNRYNSRDQISRSGGYLQRGEDLRRYIK